MRKEQKKDIEQGTYSETHGGKDVAVPIADVVPLGIVGTMRTRARGEESVGTYEPEVNVM